MDYFFQVPYEQGPIRPPSEAYSLLIRVTRGCPWNKCEFCGIYAEERFKIRAVEDIKEDIRNAAAFHAHRGVSFNTAFLQDANSLIMKTSELVEVITYLKEMFPSIQRITSYGRSHTLARKSVEELQALSAAGLSRIHIGLESGCNDVLRYMKKGVTAQEHIVAGQKVKASGISLSEYIVLGLGGKKWWRDHALDTAAVLNEIDPDFIRVRTLSVRPESPLREKLLSGEFECLSEDELILEEKSLIEHFKGINSYFVSDHMLNLLMELNGKLPDDKEKMLSIIDRYLSLPELERLNFSVGRRLGYYTLLDDMKEEERYSRVKERIDKISATHPDGIEAVIKAWMERMI